MKRQRFVLIIILSFLLVIMLVLNVYYWEYLRNSPQDNVSVSQPETLPESGIETLQDIEVITSTVPVSQIIYPADYEAVRLAWFYKPPQEEQQLAQLAEYFDVFVLTKTDEPERDKLARMVGDTTMLRYLLFNAINDPGNCQDQPLRNQVADRPGDVCYLQEEHADWFLYTESGEHVVETSGSLVMDPMNEEWRQFWLERTRQNQEELGWSGVFLDNVETSLEKRIRLASMPASYTGKEEYQAALEDFLRFLSSGYFAAEDQLLYANLIEYQDIDDWMRFLPYLDGAMMEDFAVDWHDGYLSAKTWEMQMDIAEQTQLSGKEIILVAQGDQEAAKRQEFALASFLLVNNGKAVFRYTNSDSHREIWLYPNYLVELGMPLGQRYRQGGQWQRNFERGRVIVNLVEHSGQIIIE